MVESSCHSLVKPQRLRRNSLTRNYFGAMAGSGCSCSAVDGLLRGWLARAEKWKRYAGPARLVAGSPWELKERLSRVQPASENRVHPRNAYLLADGHFFPGFSKAWFRCPMVPGNASELVHMASWLLQRKRILSPLLAAKLNRLWTPEPCLRKPSQKTHSGGRCTHFSDEPKIMSRFRVIAACLVVWALGVAAVSPTQAQRRRTRRRSHRQSPPRALAGRSHARS